MRHARILGLGSAAFVLLSLGASAAPLPITIGYLGAPNVYLYGSRTADEVIDSNAGGSFTIHGDSLGHFPWTEYHESIDEAFTLAIGWHEPGAQATDVQYALQATGTVTGSYDQRADASRVSGMYTGTATSLELAPTWLRSHDSIPPALLALVGHPERIHLTGYVTDGINNNVDLRVTIDPAPPTVPEPSTLAVLLTAGGGWGFLRRRKARG
jgi:hypothetical protein